MKKLSLIIPVYNEESSIRPFMERVTSIINKIPCIAEYIFVNDGSQDKTLNTIIDLLPRHDIICVNFTRNFGKEAALTAGISHCTGDAVIPIDVDLQDPPELLSEMFSAWQSGADIVLARRIDRSSDSWLKRKTAEWFYTIHNRLSDTQIPPNVGDFRLMDRRVVDAVLSLEEKRRFMKGIFAWVGFKSIYIDYVRPERAYGEGKFSGWRLWNFGLEGLTSFSTIPLRIWTYFGAVVSGYAFFHAIYLFMRTIIFGKDLPGYSSIMVAILFLAGVQLIGIGVLGEYIGRIYIESKNRPLYLVEGIYRATPPSQNS